MSRIFYFFVYFFLSACSSVIPTKNATLRDKMVACSASLGKEASFSLDEGLSQDFSRGALTSDFSRGVHDVFSYINSFPEKDRIRVYENYLNCINHFVVPKPVGSAGKLDAF